MTDGARPGLWLRLTDAQFLRFLMVGVLNTIVGYGVYCLGLVVFGRAEIALIIANVVGYGFNFFSIGRLVFRNRNWRTLPGFLIVAVIVYCLNLAMLNGLQAGGLNAWVGQLVCLPVVVVLNYLLMKRFVFGPGSPSSPTLV
ncbi:MAG: GtrA family protein [Ancalomicrobiaceae bacterium]|nr:GtrA family protein [Ancalomicrobiaceae bacterium]